MVHKDPGIGTDGTVPVFCVPDTPETRDVLTGFNVIYDRSLFLWHGACDMTEFCFVRSL